MFHIFLARAAFRTYPLLPLYLASLTRGLPVRIECNVVNTDRALGTTLSNHVSKRYGEEGLPKDTIHIHANGSAGQSLGAFLAPGITIELEGDANDFCGKGLSG